MRQFITFAGIGAVGTAGHYLTLIILVEFIYLSPVIATTAGFVVGAIINYVLNYKYTFNSTKNHTEAFSKFAVVAVIGAAMNAFIMQAGLEYFEINYLLVQILATAVVLLWNFFINKIWTFAEKNIEN